MKPEILKALKATIEEWKKRMRGEYVKEYVTGECPLCIAVHRDCAKCPVYERTGQIQCHKTPFRKWIKRILQAQEAAQKEVKFLESLLPKEEK